MSDESFFREVNEDVRKARAEALWQRHGITLVAVAAAVVLCTVAYVAYDYWITGKANASGDAFSAALTLANDGKSDEALAAFQSLESSGHGSYPVLARLRAATVLADKGDGAGAVAAFDAVAADGSVPQPLRDIANLRAGLILVDTGSYKDVASRVEALASVENGAFRNSAREALGLSAWKEGRGPDALKFFDQISGDALAPQNTRQRSELMSGLIRGSGATS